MRKLFFLHLLTALTVVSVLVSCAPSSFVNGRDAGTLIGVTEVSVRWSPAKHAIGDVVHLEARLSPGSAKATRGSASGDANTVIDANTSGAASADDLVPPNGETIQPLSHDYGSGDVTVRWSFRVKAAGDYTLGEKKLFSVISVAGTSTELKKFDANGLWTGRIEAAKAAQQAAPQSAPANGSAAPASGNGSPAAGAGAQNPVQGGTAI